MNKQTPPSRSVRPEPVDSITHLASLVDIFPGTLVIDVEPLIAMWGSSQEDLDSGVGNLIREIGHRRTLLVTNSKRRTEVSLPLIWEYIDRAHKPFTRLPVDAQCAVFLGDQPITDGILALRYRGRFVRVRLPRHTPAWIRIQYVIGLVLYWLVTGVTSARSTN